MTRLIDADAIKNLEWIIERGTADCGEEFVYLSAINEMPTVEAIPIAWIEERVKQAEEIDAWAYAYALVVLIGNWKAERGEE